MAVKPNYEWRTARVEQAGLEKILNDFEQGGWDIFSILTAHAPGSATHYCVIGRRALRRGGGGTVPLKG